MIVVRHVRSARKRLAPVLSCAVWLMAATATAQPASGAARPPAAGSDSTAVSGVTVEARSAASVKAFAKKVEQFVHDHGRLGMNGQVSRWRKALCPTTEGLSPAFDDFVTARIKAVAGDVGLPEQACAHGIDVLVVFTTRPDALMADIRDHHPQMLGFHEPGERKSLAKFEPPMKSWYVTLTRQGTAAKVDWDNGGLFPDLLPHGGGHFPPVFFSDFGFALVVVDSTKVEGEEIGTVADRIALLALSKPAEHDGCSALPSVLDALDSACPDGQATEGLTTYDKAYLKAFYGYQGDEDKAVERAAVRKSLMQAVGPPPASPPLP